jgi:hypothetical protein
MAARNDPLRLADAWQALGGLSGDSGWRSIHLASIGPCRVLAARRMPEDREALLLGFRDARLPLMSELPSGKGFLVEVVRDAALPGVALIALARQQGGRLDLFEAMAQDLVSVLRSEEGSADAQLVAGRVVQRIRAWQDFMLRDRAGILGDEEEIGLHGELHILIELIDSLGDAAKAVECWEGPLRGLHDFALPSGAMEVKSTASPVGFRATVSSLGQLDPAIRSPLHVAAVRFADEASGRTLPERVSLVRGRMAEAPDAAVQAFSLRLLRSGYVDAFAESYARRLKMADVRLFAVSGAFPALTVRSVPTGVVSARYVIDLDAVALPSVSLADVLQNAGPP